MFRRQCQLSERIAKMNTNNLSGKLYRVELINYLMGFRRFSRATPESQNLCLLLVDSVQTRIGFVPIGASPDLGHGEPPFLVYMPDAAPRFAHIDTIDSDKSSVVVSLYGEEAKYESTAFEKLRMKPRTGYSRIALRHAEDLDLARDLICRAYDLKRAREQLRQARHKNAKR
jgi:hypothetical protein